MTTPDQPQFSISKKQGPYDIYFGKEVKVATTSGNSYYGIFNKIEGEFIFLCPSLIREDEPIGFKNGDIKRKLICLIEEELPTKITASTIEGIEPHSKGYLKKICEAVNKIGNKNYSKKIKNSK